MYGGYRWIFKSPWNDFAPEAKEKLLGIIVSFKQNTRIINRTVNHYKVICEDENGRIKKIMKRQKKGDHWAIRRSMHKDTVGGLISLKLIKTVSLQYALNDCSSIVDRSLRSEIKRLISKNNYDKKKILKHFVDIDYRWKEKDISKVDVYYWDHDLVATRFMSELNQSFDSDKIRSVTDSGIQRILLKHLT